MMIQNGTEKAEAWNICVLSVAVVTVSMTFSCFRSKWLYVLLQFLKAGIMPSKRFK